MHMYCYILVSGMLTPSFIIPCLIVLPHRTMLTLFRWITFTSKLPPICPVATTWKWRWKANRDPS